MGESGGCHKEPSLCLATWHRDCAPIDHLQPIRCRLVMARQQCISPNSSEVSCSIKVRTWGHSNLDLFRTCDSGVALCLHTSMMVFPRRCSPFVLETAFFVFFSVFLIPPLLVSRAFCGALNRVNGISKGLVTFLVGHLVTGAKVGTSPSCVSLSERGISRIFARYCFTAFEDISLCWLHDA